MFDEEKQYLPALNDAAENTANTSWKDLDYTKSRCNHMFRNPYSHKKATSTKTNTWQTQRKNRV